MVSGESLALSRQSSHRMFGGLNSGSSSPHVEVTVGKILNPKLP